MTSRRRPKVPAVWLLGSLLAAAPAAAQERSVHTWALDARASNEYESNVRFVPGGPSDISQQVAGSGGFIFETARSNLTTIGHVEQARYERLTDLTRLTYGVNADARHAFTRRFTVNGSLGYNTVLSRNVVPTAAAGIGLGGVPTALSHNFSVGTTTTYALSELVQTRSDITFTQVKFDGRALANGASLTIREAVSRQVDERSTFGFTYESLQNQTLGDVYVVHNVLADWTRRYPSAELALHAGVSAYTAPTPVHLSPSGAAELRHRTEHGTIAAHYERTVTQAFGLGKVLTSDLFGASGDHTFRRYVFRANATQSRGTDSQIATYRLQTTNATLDLERPVTSTLKLTSGVYFRRRVETLIANDHGFRFALAYTDRGT